MPRGRKSYTLDEQLERTVNEIKECESRLQMLQDKKKKLEETIENHSLSELRDIIAASGKTVNEVKEMLMKGNEGA